MDQLDLLKKDWKKQEKSLPKLSYDDLSKIIHKKSSSIVKWIFIISVLELLLPHLVYLFTDSSTVIEEIKELDLQGFILFMNIFLYSVVLIFIYLFYKNYKSISANSNPKVLMQNIIKTRKTVKYYIWFNLSLIPITGGVLIGKQIYATDFLEKLPEGTSIILVWFVVMLILSLLVVVFWLFYRLIYGILLNKLKANYKELINFKNGDL